MAKKKGHGKARRGAAMMGKGLMAAGQFLAKRASLYGVAAQYGEEMLEEHWETAQKKWWASPLAVLGLAASGQLVKEPTPRIALAGAAGHSAGIRYKYAQFVNGKRDTSPLHYWNFKDEEAPAPAAKTSPNAQGYDDTGLRNVVFN